MTERADFERRFLRKDEVPEHAWEFSLWLRRYAKKRQITEKLTAAQYAEVAAEAMRRGLTVEEDRRGPFLNIDYVKH